MSESVTPDLRDVGNANPRGYEGFRGVIAPRASASQPWWPVPLRAPEGAPNVIVILVDDLGFSDVQPFGSEIETPGLVALADDGYKLSNFRVTPLCAPSRAALLTGANPHRAGFGMVPHLDPGYPGMRMSIPENMPTLAETFRSSGYATFMVGKWHLTPEAKMHDGAEKSTWPLQRGFDRYFGALEGFTTLFHPHRIVRDNSPVTEKFADDDYLTDRLTDEAISMIDSLQAGGGTRPFFLYFAHHAVHGPVQAKSGDIERFRGVYDAGWDAMREARFARQRELGLFNESVELAKPEQLGFDENIPWDELSQEKRELFARHMEVYAAAVSAVDESVSKLVAHLKRIGEYDNTIIVFTSDNGGTDEGGPEGTRSYFSEFVHQVDLPDDWVGDVPRDLADMGGPRVHGHYPRGWAHVSNTPFRAYKGATFEGGVHSPLIVSWPNGLPREAADNGVRDRFAYITDIAPTLIELAGIARPAALHGQETLDADGHSFASLLRGETEDVDRGQYISLMGGRAYYQDQWKLVVPQPVPGSPPGPLRMLLFDIQADPTEQRDVAAEHPEIVEMLSEKWRQDAWHNTVFPLLDGPAAFATVPSTVLELSQPVTLRHGGPTLERYRSSRLTLMRSFQVDVAFEGDLGEGVLFSHGDQGGGYAVWIEGGKLHFSYNAYGVMHRHSRQLSDAVSTVRLTFDVADGARWGITIDIDRASEVAFESVPMLLGMAPFTGISVGFDGAGPVDWDLHERKGEFRYQGDPFTVTYVPGKKASINREIVHAIDEVSARLMD